VNGIIKPKIEVVSTKNKNPLTTDNDAKEKKEISKIELFKK